MSKQVIRYGEETTYQWQDDVVLIESVKIHDYQKVPNTQSKRYVKKVFTDSRKDAVAEMLNMLDKLDDDEVLSIAFNCDKKTNGKKYRVDLSWVVQ